MIKIVSVVLKTRKYEKSLQTNGQKDSERSQLKGKEWSRIHNLLVDDLLICLKNLHNGDTMISDRNIAKSKILYFADLEGNLLSLEFGKEF